MQSCLISITGDFLELEIIAVDIEEGMVCEYDYLEVRRGIDESGSLIGRLCGSGQAGSFVSSGSLWVHFHSDSSVAWRGFRARYSRKRNC